jgi:hypothetical protein
MADTDITRLNYGGKIATDAPRMAEGMIEMFDEMADLALSRIYVRTAKLEQGFDLAAVSQDDIGRFKIAWLTSLGELMLHGLAGQPKLADIRREYYAEINRAAEERDLQAFAAEAAEAARAAISSDKDFNERGILSAPMSNDPEDETPRNRGLGPDLAARMTETAFAASGKLTPILQAVGELVEAELGNAYAHGSVACDAFEVT